MMMIAAATPKKGRKQQADLMPAVAYIRMSTDIQEDSPDIQRNQVKRLAEEQGYELIGEYFDEAISGNKTSKRLSFLRMVKDAEKGKFKAILVKHTDRFGRFDMFDAGEFVAPLRRAGVKLVSVAQGEIDWNSQAGRIMFGISTEQSHDELVKFADRSISGKADKARHGYWFGRVPYGYARAYVDSTGKEHFRKPRNAGRVQIEGLHMIPVKGDRKEVKTVRYVMETFANTEASLGTIAKALNRRGVTPPGNGKAKKKCNVDWMRRTIWGILRNEAYVGTYIFGTRKGGEYVQAKGSTRIEDNHDALVSKELFARVQEKLARMKVTGSRSRSRSTWSLVQGIVYCGHCGGRLTGTTNAKNRYYKCNSSVLGGLCISRHVRADVLHKSLIDLMREKVLAADAIDAIRADIRERVIAAREGQRGNSEDFDSQIQALDAKIDLALENFLEFTDADDRKRAMEKITQWKGERSELRRKSTKQKPIDDNRLLTPDQIANQAVEYLQVLPLKMASASIGVAKAAMREVFDSITITWKERENTTGKKLAKTSVKHRVSEAKVVLRDCCANGVVLRSDSGRHCNAVLQLEIDSLEPDAKIVQHAQTLRKYGSRGVTTHDFAKVLEVGYGGAWHILTRLESLGRAQRIHPKADSQRARWRCTEFDGQPTGDPPPRVVRARKPLAASIEQLRQFGTDGANAAQYARACGLNYVTAYDQLTRAVGQGLVRRIGKNYVHAKPTDGRKEKPKARGASGNSVDRRKRIGAVEPKRGRGNRTLAV